MSTSCCCTVYISHFSSLSFSVFEYVRTYYTELLPTCFVLYIQNEFEKVWPISYKAITIVAFAAWCDWDKSLTSMPILNELT